MAVRRPRKGQAGKGASMSPDDSAIAINDGGANNGCERHTVIHTDPGVSDRVRSVPFLFHREGTGAAC